MSPLPLRRIEVAGEGAEDVLLDTEGRVLTGTADGTVHRIDAREDPPRVETVAHTGGRPLGLEWLPDGRLLVCDTTRGLLAVDLTSGAVEVLADEAGGRPILVCNNAAVSRDGDVWFTDSSAAYRLEHWKRDFGEHTCSGRLLCRRADGTVEVHLEGLAFANGVALARDESFVLVAESGGARVVRVWLTGPRAGHDETWVDLPGYPDNIARGTDDLVWVTIGSPRSPLVDLLRHRVPRPLRRLLVRLPEALLPRPARTVHVQAYDDRAGLVHDVRADATRFHMATGVREHHGQVWIGSVEEAAVAVVAVPPV